MTGRFGGVLGVCVVCAGTPVAAADWQMLAGPEIATALSGQKMSYGQAWQRFDADGRTVYNDGSDTVGKWRVSGDFYCSQWPPTPGWTCYQVKRDASDGALQFISESGGKTIGLPID